MTQTQAPPRRRPPAPAVLAAVLGLAGAAASGLMAGALVGLGALGGDEGGAGWWLAALVGATVVQVWGAVRLLLGRGWVLLAVGSLPGLLPGVALIGVWLEYRQGVGPLELLAVVPVVTFLLTLSRPVRRWADGPAV
jgi:hypothetical protein